MNYDLMITRNGHPVVAGDCLTYEQVEEEWPFVADYHAEDASFRELEVTCNGSVVSLKRSEPQTEQILLTYQVGEQGLRPHICRHLWLAGSNNSLNIVGASLSAIEPVPAPPSVTEIRAAAQVAPAEPEGAFRAACLGSGEDVTPLEWLSALLSELRELHYLQHIDNGEHSEETERWHVFMLADDTDSMWTAYRECENLLLSLRSACENGRVARQDDREPPSGSAGGETANEEALSLLADMAEYWDNDTPLCAGSLIVQDAYRLLRDAGRRGGK